MSREGDEPLAAAVAEFLAAGVESGDSVVVIATERQRRVLREQLIAAGLDVDQTCESGQLALHDAEQVLAEFMRAGEPNEELFRAVIGGLIGGIATSSGARRVRAYGEMIDLLWRRGQRRAALRVEQLWNDFRRDQPFSVLCAYEGESGRCAPLRDSIAQLRKAEEELRQSEEQLRDFLENATVGLHRVGADGTILWANRAELELLGYGEEEYIGRSIADFHVDRETIEDILGRLRRGEELHDREARLRAKDGSIKHVQISSNVYRRDGEFVHTRCFTRDITERRQAEDAARKTERELELIADALPALVAYVGPDHRYRYVSAAYERWFDRSRAAIIGQHVKDVIGVGGYETVERELDRALSGTAVTYQAEIPYKTGGPRHVEATYTPQFGPDGKVEGVVALVTDITEKMSFECFRAAALARSERLSRITAAIADAVTSDQVFEATVDHVAAAIQASSAALWLIDDDGRNARLMRALGYSPAARQRFERVALDSRPSFPALDAMVRGEPIFISSQAELLAAYPHLSAAVSAGRSYRIACLPLTAHGRTLGALGITIEQGADPGGEDRQFLLLVARYATQAIERLRLFEAERTSRAQAEQLYHFAQAVVAAERVEQVFEAALSAIESSLGTNRAAVLIRDERGVMRFRAWRNLSDAYRAAVDGHSPWSADARVFEPILVPDAQSAPELAAYAELFRAEAIGALAFIPLVTNGRLVGKFMIYYDRPHRHSAAELEVATAIANHLASVTARFTAMARLEEAIRVSELSAGVLAHDLRNPLGAIMTAAQLVLMRQEGEGEGGGRNAKPLSRILTSGQRMSRMIDQLLDFTLARTGGGIQIQPRLANLAELCSQALGEIELIHPEWKTCCDVVGDQSGSWDPDRLLQIISNLVSNAGQHGDPDAGIRIVLDGSRADSVRLEVHNAGAVPDALLPLLFDPFRGTRHRRDQSRGLGLGLYIVREIVTAHGGTVDVVSSEAVGTTTFTVSLPRHVRA